MRNAIVLACALVVLGACGNAEPVYSYPEKTRGNAKATYSGDKKEETIFGEGGILGGGKKSSEEGAGGGGIGVNSYLWRATLDTLAFMPLSAADPFGGVIITDWHSPPETPAERFKMNVYIMGRDLRADGIRVSVFHQNKAADGGWVEAPANAKTATELEDAILVRARQLRMDTAQQK